MNRKAAMIVGTIVLIFGAVALAVYVASRAMARGTEAGRQASDGGPTGLTPRQIAASANDPNFRPQPPDNVVRLDPIDIVGNV